MSEHVCEQQPQVQSDLSEQLRRLISVAQRHGLYDAADWVKRAQAQRRGHQHYDWTGTR